MSFSNIRQRLHKRRHRHHDDTDPIMNDLKSYNLDDSDGEKFDDGDNTSIASKYSEKSAGSTIYGTEKQAYEDQLTILQDQLVSAMIENQNLEQELKQCKENEANERLKDDLQKEKKRNRLLQDQINNSDPGPRRTVSTKRVEVRPNSTPNTPGGMLPPETPPVEPRSEFDRFWERTVDMLYDVMEEFNDITQHEPTMKIPEENLSVKTLKDNIRRFKVAVKPVTDTVKGISNLFAWKSRSYTFIVFVIYMYSVWKGYFLPLMFLLMAIRIVVNYFHFRGMEFEFSYLDPGEQEKESDDALGLSDKFNLVLMVATKVQNGLGAAADTLEKIKNLLTWRHEGTSRVLVMLCVACVAFTILPQSFVWRFIGLGFGVKIFLVNCVYNKYPKIKRRYDSTYRMWQTLPTDAQYHRKCAKTEMNRYIVVQKQQSRLETSADSVISVSSSDSSDDSDDESAEFRQVFSLPVTECPLRGWLHGKRTVLLGKGRSLYTLLTKKRGKLFLTKSFLCFERERCPSPRNIVIPLQDIVSIDKVKINQRMPGSGMTLQLQIRSDGRDKILLFSGVIGRDDIIRDVTQSIEALRRSSPERGGAEPVSRRISSESTSSRTQNFTFAAYYEDSE